MLVFIKQPNFMMILLFTVYFMNKVGAEEATLNFLLIGDWGKGGYSSTKAKHMNIGDFQNEESTNQVAVAKAMAAYSKSIYPLPEFVVALGDNFYDSGVSSYEDELWTKLWKNVYMIYESLNIPWYAVFGNHDYGYGESGVRAQIDRNYVHDEDDLWKMESTNYTKRFCIDDVNICQYSLQIIFIDTTTLAPSENACCNSKGGISSQVQEARIKNQLYRIQDMLEEAVQDPPTWLLVAGHYPVFSQGEHGDTMELHKYLLPLLGNYSVQAYICGHDHISEHLHHKNVEYFVVGAGCMTDSLKQSSSGNLLWSGTKYSAFALMEATPSNLTIRYIDTSGNNKYTYTLTNPNQPHTIIDFTNQTQKSNSSNYTSDIMEKPNHSETSYRKYIMFLATHPYLIVVVTIILSCLIAGFLLCFIKKKNLLKSSDMHHREIKLFEMEEIKEASGMNGANEISNDETSGTTSQFNNTKSELQISGQQHNYIQLFDTNNGIEIYSSDSDDEMIKDDERLINEDPGRTRSFSYQSVKSTHSLKSVDNDKS